jgi:hypothetical protein
LCDEIFEIAPCFYYIGAVKGFGGTGNGKNNGNRLVASSFGLRSGLRQRGRDLEVAFWIVRAEARTYLRSKSNDNDNSRSPSGMTNKKAKATATATGKYGDPSLRSG